MVESSGDETPEEEAAEISHDSKAENRIDVEIPPRTRPTYNIGSAGKNVQTQAKAYVTQKAKHTRLRPLLMRDDERLK